MCIAHNKIAEARVSNHVANGSRPCSRILKCSPRNPKAKGLSLKWDNLAQKLYFFFIFCLFFL
jgi:hypothetical protein